MGFKLNIIILLNIFLSLIGINRSFPPPSHDSKISIVIAKSGSQKIIDNSYIPYLLEVEINSTIQNETKNIYDLKMKENIIIMKFDDNLNTCDNMFNCLDNIIEIDLSGFNSKNVENMEKMFYNCTSLTSINFGNFQTNQVTNMKQLFSGCFKLSSLDLSNYNTGEVRNIEYMFCDCRALKKLDLSNFNTEKVKSLKYLFYGCSQLNELKTSKKFVNSNINDTSYLFYNCKELTRIDLSDYDTSSVIDMAYMFSHCRNIDSFDLSSFNTSKVKSMIHMFEYCTTITTLDLSNFNTSSVNRMNYMFYNCINLKGINFMITDEEKKTIWLRAECRRKNIFGSSNYDECVSSATKHIIYNFDTSKVTNMRYMFGNCKSLEYFDLSHFKTSSVENMEYMFLNCNQLTSINFTNIDTSKVKNMAGLFKGCEKLSNIPFSNFKTSSLVNISHIFERSNIDIYLRTNLLYFDISRVKDMSFMFSSCTADRIDLSDFNISSVTNISHMFSNCTNLVSFSFKNTITSKVTNMDGLFKNCSSLESIDLSDLKTSSLTNISHIFENCKKLKSVSFSNFDISLVEDLSYMFSSCHSLISIDLSNMNTNNVKNMSYLFYDCKQLISINLKNLNTEKVEQMNYMFASCTELRTIDLTSINTKSVLNMKGMFYLCINLQYLNISNFITEKVEDMSYMFSNCHNLISLNISNFSTSSVNYMNYIFDSCYNLTYLDISNFNTENVLDMSYMFNDCNKLNSLNLSHFSTLSVKNMNHMFSGCKHITFLDIWNFKSQFAINMEYMFTDCNELISIKLSEFNTLKTNNIGYMFSGCYKLISINLLNFETHEVTTMEKMFNGCESLTSLNLTNLKTSKVSSMDSLFNDCKKLKILDLNNFDLSQVKNMKSMFSGCESLTSVYLPKSSTTNLVSMENMFYNCKNLRIINLSSFTTSLVTNMANLFSGCEKLLYLDLKNFNFSVVSDISSMFEKCSSLIYLNVGRKSNNNINLKYDKIFENNANDTKYCMEISNYDLFSNYEIKSNCSDICFQEGISIIFEKRICIKKCEFDEEFKFEYNKQCFISCPKGTHIAYKDEFLCEDDVKCPEFNINNTKCKENAKYGYYFDTNDGIYKACYKNCKKCYGPGNKENNNCSECIETLTFINESIKIKNCFPICNYNYFIDSYNNYYCTNDTICPNDYKNYIPNKKKCIRKCKNDNIYQFEYENICYLTCPNRTTYRSNKKICIDIDSISNDTKKADIAEKEEKISSLKEDLMSGDMDDILKNVTENKEDYVQNEDNLKIQLTTSENQKNSSNKNISSIDLGDCEDELKRVYHINETLQLIILKIDYYTKDTLIPIVAYEIYHPITKEKLNLSYCEEILIKMNIPVTIDENNLFKYDPNSKFYTDNCNSYTTNDGTDIILNDRKKEFGDNKLSLCENNCKYVGYNKDNKQSICNCGIKSEMESISYIDENDNKLSNEFEGDSSSSANMISIKCTKNLFTSDGLKNNISSYVLLIIIFYFLLSILFFIKCGYALLIMEMDKIIKNKEAKKNKKHKKYKTINQLRIINNFNIQTSMPPFRRINYNVINRINNKIKKRYQTRMRSNLPNLDMNRLKTISISNNTKNKKVKGKSSINNKKKINNENENKIKINLNDYELNVLCYQEAIKYDKRTCFEYYICLIRIKHPILFGFCPFKDYNTFIIKSCIFFLSFAIYYAMNFVFFSEDTIHKIYEDAGKYDFFYFIPQISIAFAISHIITIIIKLIFLSERNIAEINLQQSIEQAYDLQQKEKRNLIIKYSFFFILGIIFLGIFWLFLSSFGAVYQNTQIVVFENTLISFGISLVYPFFINVIPCIFRMCSLNSKNHELGFIYSLSKFFQII